MAIRAHRRDPERGRFFPRPADLLSKLQGTAAAHVPADLAWALALDSFDESRTVAWTEAIAEARALALPVWLEGDKVGARMAFKAAYEALISVGGPPRWSVSLGHDAEQRGKAIEEAVRRGLLSREQAAGYLPAPEAAGGHAITDAARLLTGKVLEHPARADGEYRQRMTALRAAIMAGGQAQVEQRAGAEARRAQARADERARKEAMLQALERRPGAGAQEAG